MNEKSIFKMIRMPLQLRWSKLAFKFLQFTNNHICVEVAGNVVNRGVGLGLEILVNYFFMGM